MEIPLKILLFFELLACVFGIINYNKVKNTPWQYFSLYLIFIVFSEILGVFLLLYLPDTNYNTFYFSYFEIPIEFNFFFLLFYLFEKNPGKRKLPGVFAVIYLIAWLSGIFYFKEKHPNFDSVSYTIGALLLLILILRFFIRLITSDELMKFRENRLFWVCLGLLTFYLGSFPYFSLISIPHQTLKNLLPKYKELFTTYMYIVYGLNSFMYLTFAFSFIWGKNKTSSH